MKNLILFLTVILSACSAQNGAQASVEGSSLNQQLEIANNASEEPPVSNDEAALGPWLDLKGGGVSIGPAQTVTVQNPDGTKSEIYGGLQNGTLLPASGTGFMRKSAVNESWGAGMMISLIENSAAEFVQKYYPGETIYLGDISQQFGGKYGPHKSHQNGLDADFWFVGNKRYESVLDANGNVTAKFQVEKNWQYWRMLVNQKILDKGKPTSVVSMILVSPEIKTFLCGWAKENNLLQNPLDVEVLRRLRPTESHDDHFHLRLKCSPYHLECRKQGDFSSGTGCE